MTPDTPSQSGGRRSETPAVRPTSRILVRLFLLFLVGGPLVMWFTISPYVTKRLNHREWTQWARQDLRALAEAVEAYHAAEGAWPPALALLTHDPEPRTSIEPRRRRHARPTPTPTPLPPEVAARTFIPHLPVDPYAPGFDFPNGQVYQYALLAERPGSPWAFILLSPGPDFTINLDLSAPPGPDSLPALAYDPTNGLISGGDIFIARPME